jgi:hypothetical protein
VFACSHDARYGMQQEREQRRARKHYSGPDYS